MKKKTNQKDPQGRHHGLWENYYPNSSLSWKGHYFHGKLQGLWENYRSNGTIFRKIYHLPIR